MWLFSDLEEVDAFSSNFEIFGYESLYFVLNMQSLFYFLVIAPVVMLMIHWVHNLSIRWCRAQNCFRRKLRHMKKDIFYNGISAFFSKSILIILVIGIVNIKFAIKGVIKYDANFYLACFFILTVILYMVWLAKILLGYEENRGSTQYQLKYRDAYKDLNIREIGFTTYIYHAA